MEKKEKLQIPTKSKILLAFNAGLLVMSGLVYLVNDSDERVANIQEHNMQIEDSLERDFPGMGSLILNDDTDTFEFHVDRKGESLTCNGEYSVSNEGIAKPTGEVTCSRIIELTEAGN